MWFLKAGFGKTLRSEGVVEEVLSYLTEADCTYEKEDAIWFCSTKYGDDKDRVLMKSDGSITYFVPECCLSFN